MNDFIIKPLITPKTAILNFNPLNHTTKTMLNNWMVANRWSKHVFSCEWSSYNCSRWFDSTFSWFKKFSEVALSYFRLLLIRKLGFSVCGLMPTCSTAIINMSAAKVRFVFMCDSCLMVRLNLIHRFFSSKTGDDILSEKLRFEWSLSSNDEHFNLGSR